MVKTLFPISDCTSELVSVILPVHNGMPYLPLSIASLLNQTYSNIEVIVVDDGSDDNTGEYLQSLSDSRLRVLREDICRGVVAALSRGLLEARGEYFARQDADDFSHPERLERQVRYLQNHPDIAVVATCAHFVDDDGNPIDTDWTRAVRHLHDPAVSPDQLRSLLPLTCCLIHGAIMARTSILREAGGYRTKFEWAEDYDLWLRLLPWNGFAKLPDRLYTYRIHRQQVSSQRRQLQTNRTIRAKLEYLRRIASQQTEYIRVMILGDNPGTRLYQQIAPELGLKIVPCGKTTSSSRHHLENGACCIDRLQDWDVVIATNFSKLEECDQLLSSFLDVRLKREGNFFIQIGA
jgi:glycosyltransferase involved in cell wall biosynthesis